MGVTGDYASFLRINIGGDAGSELIVTMSTQCKLAAYLRYLILEYTLQILKL